MGGFLVFQEPLKVTRGYWKWHIQQTTRVRNCLRASSTTALLQEMPMRSTRRIGIDGRLTAEHERTWRVDNAYHSRPLLRLLLAMTVNCSEWRDKKQWRHVDWQTRAPAREPAATAATTPHSRRNRIRSRGGQLRSTQHLGQWSYTILFWYIVATSAHKPHRQHAGCGPFIHMSHVAWSMCLCSVQGWDV